MLIFFKYLQKKLKALFKRLKMMKVAKSLLFIFGICLLSYYIKNLPLVVESSEFIKYLDSNTPITNVKILGNNIFFSKYNRTYFTDSSKFLNMMIVSKLL